MAPQAFGQYTTQEQLFETTVVPVIDEVLQGFNCTVFAYGQTGTGKTYTMEGDLDMSEHSGIIPRSIHTVFKHLETNSSEYSVRLSFLELYNEVSKLSQPPLRLADAVCQQLEDLCNDPAVSDTKLRIVEDKHKGVVCQGQEEVLVHTAEEVLGVVKSAVERRKVAETKMNKASSRSHCIFTLTIHTKETTPDGEDLLKVRVSLKGYSSITARFGTRRPPRSRLVYGVAVQRFGTHHTCHNKALLLIHLLAYMFVNDSRWASSTLSIWLAASAWADPAPRTCEHVRPATSTSRF